MNPWLNNTMKPHSIKCLWQHWLYIILSTCSSSGCNVIYSVVKSDMITCRNTD